MDTDQFQRDVQVALLRRQAKEQEKIKQLENPNLMIPASHYEREMFAINGYCAAIKDAIHIVLEILHGIERKFE